VFSGEGDECDMSGVQLIHGPDAKTSEIGYTRVEDQREIWEGAKRIDRLIGERLKFK
jgi:hypothetical protein